LDQTIGVGVRQRIQQHGFRDPKDCSVRADAERDRDDRRGREGGTRCQAASGIADVLKKIRRHVHSSATFRAAKCIDHASAVSARNRLILVPVSGHRGDRRAAGVPITRPLSRDREVLPLPNPSAVPAAFVYSGGELGG
jgi:hypothetical protein